MDWAHEKWADHLRNLQQSWQADSTNIEAVPERAFGGQRLLISQWVDFLVCWLPSTGGMDGTLQEMIDEIIPEAAHAVGLDPLDFWFKVTTLWNWRQARKQEYEDECLMIGGFTALGHESAPKRRKRASKRRKSAEGGR